MAHPTANVTVTATHVVNSKHPIFLQDPFILGPFDQLLHFGIPVSAVWIYESSSSSAGLIPIERLRNAISRLLDYYPHLTGRLRIDPNTDVRSITRLSSGVHLLEAYCDAPLRSFATASGRELSIFDFPNVGNVLLAPWDTSLEGTQRDPVFTIQRTEFACASVAIGIRLSHVLASAGGFLRLYQDLAAIYRATTMTFSAIEGQLDFELASPPDITPFMVTPMLHMRADEQKKALAEQPPAYSLRDRDANAETHAQNEARSKKQNAGMDPIVGRTLRFSPAAIATLKGRTVDRTLGSRDTPSNAREPSAFTALSAHLWQRTHRARLALGAPPTSNSTSEDVLSRSVFGTNVNFIPHLGLPERLFGNTILTPYVELESTKLSHAPLWEISKIISGLVHHVSEDEVRQIGSWVAAQPKKSRIQLDFPVMPTSFIASGWHRFPLYSGTEFDVAPALASPVFMDAMFDGMVYFLEAKAQDGGVDAIISLRSSIWGYLDQDKEFITNWDRAG
ncbi:transferase [Aspergillus caelatus]|uniref:Transferase n=1 Tax=Aspergillus caelatus TaxID=61420 RepID=A0A5N6ZVQ2_9EURO|nr:transferase [Aspergillus caelatus]KAE8361681.1 transferase [Aspergillus caelatus]